MRQIIFLDIDGVLATPETIGPDGFYDLTPRCVQQLQRILAAHPAAELVISSSWRRATIEQTKEYMLAKGMPKEVVYRIRGITIRSYRYLQKGVAMSIPRGVEIRQWIDHNICSGGNGQYTPGINGTYEEKCPGMHYQYVILDDDIDMLYEQAQHFIRCHGGLGLTSELADRAIDILGRKMNDTSPNQRNMARAKDCITSATGWVAVTDPLDLEEIAAHMMEMDTPPQGREARKKHRK